MHNESNLKHLCLSIIKKHPTNVSVSCFVLQIMYWDSQSVFIEHKFITPKDNFINAIAISRIRIVNCDVEDIMKELLEKCKLQDTETPTKVEKPEIPLEIARWIECNEISSNKLRNGA